MSIGRLANKIAVVTGAGSGIGRATAKLFTQEGAHVFIADINDENAHAVARECGERAFAVHVDVVRREDVERLFAEVKSRFGKLDVLISNAGLPYQLTSLEASEDQWNECLDLNLQHRTNLLTLNQCPILH